MRFFQYYPLMPNSLDDASPLVMSLLAPPPLKRKIAPCHQVAKRFRVACDCRGFSADAVKAELTVDGKKLVITARERSGDDEQYTLNEFRRSFDVPDNADTSKMKTFRTASGHFIVDMPLKVADDANKDEDSDGETEDWLLPFPKIFVNKETGVKEARMSVPLPHEIDPSKVRVTVKDHDVIVEAKDDESSGGRGQSVTYMRRNRMPAQCDMQALRCLFDSKRGNRLLLNAPLKKELENVNNGWKAVTVENMPQPAVAAPSTVEVAPSKPTTEAA